LLAQTKKIQKDLSVWKTSLGQLQLISNKRRGSKYEEVDQEKEGESESSLSDQTQEGKLTLNIH